MSLVLEERARLEAAHGCAELAFCFGFPYADFPGCGVAIAGYAETQEAADAAVAALKAYMDAHEPDFAGGVAPAAEGVAEAIALARGASQADRHGRHPGQSGRRRPWRHHRPARRADPAGRAGRRARPDQRCRERRRLPRGGRRRDAAALAGRQERRRAAGGHRGGGSADRWPLHRHRADVEGQPGRSRPDRADPRLLRASGSSWYAEDAGAGPVAVHPYRCRAQRAEDPGAEVQRAFPGAFPADRRDR